MAKTSHDFEIFFPFVRMDEIFDFHLGAFTIAEDKVARTDFVTECLSLLGNAEWKARINSIENIFVISEDTLGSFGAKVGDVLLDKFGGVIWHDGANVSSEHHVEFTNWAPVFFATDWAFSMGGVEFFGSDGFVDIFSNFVSAKTRFTFFTFD